MKKEKRIHPRFSVKLPIEYWETPDASRGGLVGNVSERGLLIHSVHWMDVSLEIRVKVSFSMGYGFDSFEALAKIVWRDVLVETGWEGYRYGLEFIQISQGDWRKLRALLVMEEEQRLHQANMSL